MKNKLKSFNINVPFSSNNRKRLSVIENFGIDPQENIYIIYDETILGNCKKGFVLTDKGFYYKQKHPTAFIPWNDFGKFKIKSGLSLSIGEMSFATTKKEGNIVEYSLNKLQELLK